MATNDGDGSIEVIFEETSEAIQDIHKPGTTLSLKNIVVRFPNSFQENKVLILPYPPNQAKTNPTIAFRMPRQALLQML